MIKVSASIEFVGPGCWMWTITTPGGERDGIAATREQAIADATAAVRSDASRDSQQGENR